MCVHLWDLLYYALHQIVSSVVSSLKFGNVLEMLDLVKLKLYDRND